VADHQNHHIGPQQYLPGGSCPHLIFTDLANAGIDVDINGPGWNLQPAVACASAHGPTLLRFPHSANGTPDIRFGTQVSYTCHTRVIHKDYRHFSQISAPCGAHLMWPRQACPNLVTIRFEGRKTCHRADSLARKSRSIGSASRTFSAPT
jgi:hypothetical protein